MVRRGGRKVVGEGSERTNLGRCNNEGIPIDARQDIEYQLGIRLDGVGFEFAVSGVEGEGGGAGFAGFDGAGEEVEG